MDQEVNKPVITLTRSSAFMIFALIFNLGLTAAAEETVLEKVEMSKNRAKYAVKRTYRESKNKTCEMVNGKLECLAKKAANKARDISDKARTDAVEVKNKID